MRIVTLVARLLLGSVFLASGVAYFFTTPPPMEGPIADFFNGMMASRYFLYLLKGTEIVCGLALLSGFFVPLALVVLAPIILNIFLVHAFMAPEGLPLAIVIGVVEVYLAFFSAAYSPTVRSLFRPKGET
jgi:uncharacterized membrane protein YphA (DoxX/SURF4 family)